MPKATRDEDDSDHLPIVPADPAGLGTFQKCYEGPTVAVVSTEGSRARVPHLAWLDYIGGGQPTVIATNVFISQQPWKAYG